MFAPLDPFRRATKVRQGHRELKTVLRICSAKRRFFSVNWNETTPNEPEAGVAPPQKGVPNNARRCQRQANSAGVMAVLRRD
jgi:hypothetical protein